MQTDFASALVNGVVAVFVWAAMRCVWARIMAPFHFYFDSTKKMKVAILNLDANELNAAKIALADLMLLGSQEAFSADQSEINDASFGAMNINQHPIFKAHGLNVLRAQVIRDGYELIRGHSERSPRAARRARAKFRKKAQRLMDQISNPDP